jgi:hypothetical protein
MICYGFKIITDSTSTLIAIGVQFRRYNWLIFWLMSNDIILDVNIFTEGGQNILLISETFCLFAVSIFRCFLLDKLEYL